MRFLRLIGCGALLLGWVGAASAKDVTVHVDGRAMPWSVGGNPKLNFGRHDGKPPAMVWGLHLVSGTRISFTATGTTTTQSGGMAFGPDGQAEFVTDATAGNSGAFFPSRYVDAKTYPAHLNELVGAFVDADGKVVGKPFLIGHAAEVTVPDGALAIGMGINDDIFGENAGGLDVVIHARTGEVIVE